MKQFAYIFIHLKSCVEKKKNQRNEHSLSLQPIIFPSTQNILINRKNSYNSMYKRKPKWNLSLTDHFNRNVRVGRLRIIYTQQNIDKLAFNVTKGKKRNLKNRKRNLFDFMSALWGVPVVKVRQKSDHKHWKTILTSYQYKLDQHTNHSASLNLKTRLVRGGRRKKNLINKRQDCF